MISLITRNVRILFYLLFRQVVISYLFDSVMIDFTKKMNRVVGFLKVKCNITLILFT